MVVVRLVLREIIIASGGIVHEKNHSLFYALSHSLLIRCGINAIWYVTGEAGSYQIHARGHDSTEHIDACLSSSICNTINSSVTSDSCRSCGAKDWNIVGDTEVGSVLTQSNNKYCVKRDGKQAIIDLCDNGYVTFKIEFITKDNLLKMNSDGMIFTHSLTPYSLTH